MAIVLSMTPSYFGSLKNELSSSKTQTTPKQFLYAKDSLDE